MALNMGARVPVITIDGPSGAGKGTVAQRLAERLGFHLLDSGAIYRAAALQVLTERVDVHQENLVIQALKNFRATFKPSDCGGVEVRLNEINVTKALRTEDTAAAASLIAAMPAVRQLLLEQQRRFRQSPGLIADGRDMGTVVFPDASLKVFLTASAAVRARRRSKQLKEKGISTTMAGLLQDIELRDKRDSTREHAPLAPATDAITIDCSELSIDAVVDQIIAAVPGS